MGGRQGHWRLYKNTLREGKENMLTPKKNYTTILVALIAALNTAAMQLGWYHLNEKGLQVANEVVSYLVVVAGILMSHRKNLKQYLAKLAFSNFVKNKK